MKTTTRKTYSVTLDRKVGTIKFKKQFKTLGDARDAVRDSIDRMGRFAGTYTIEGPGATVTITPIRGLIDLACDCPIALWATRMAAHNMALGCGGNKTARTIFMYLLTTLCEADADLEDQVNDDVLDEINSWVPYYGTGIEPINA